MQASQKAYCILRVCDPLAHLLHTVGHNLGGEHPFYDQELVKPGESGGIMDYGSLTDAHPLRYFVFHVWPITHPCPQPTAIVVLSGVSLWAGETQFGTFNRWRMCPVIEVLRSLPVLGSECLH